MPLLQQLPYVLPLLAWLPYVPLSPGTALLSRVSIPFSFLFGISIPLVINKHLFLEFCDTLLIIQLKLPGTFFYLINFPCFILHCHFDTAIHRLFKQRSSSLPVRLEGMQVLKKYECSINLHIHDPNKIQLEPKRYKKTFRKFSGENSKCNK